jgi:hypothetical protein
VPVPQPSSAGNIAFLPAFYTIGEGTILKTALKPIQPGKVPRKIGSVNWSRLSDDLIWRMSF